MIKLSRKFLKSWDRFKVFKVLSSTEIELIIKTKIHR